MIYTKIINRLVIVCLLLLANSSHSWAQEKQPCGTMQVLEHAFKENPLLQTKFKKQQVEFQQSVNKRIAALPMSGVLQDTIYIPVVFHIVLTDPAVITDAQIKAQLAVLNNDFAGSNRDSVNLPAGFKPLFGKSRIRFKLAQRTPDNEPTNGIVRTITTKAVYSTFDNTLKYTAHGGDNAWDHNRYFNVWITNLSLGYVLGYATMPGTSVPEEDGVVIHYTTLPADSLTTYNRGRTLTHEAGHYFYLYHIWGDENGCTGTDFVDDTPNQTTLTSGCPGGAVVTDACSPFAPGILYQNYMDYTDDACMCLFTNEQVMRMETAINDYRKGYDTTTGGDPVINPNLLSKGFLVTPNPATDAITVQFYPSPPGLKAVVLYNSSGQKVGEQVAKGATTSYRFDLSRLAGGVYFVQAVFSGKKLTQKVMKR